MPTASIDLKPGVNTERTMAANEAGVSISQLLRYKEGMIQTLGGWQSILTVIPSTVRDIHVWQDVSAVSWLSAAATMNLITLNSSSSQDVTPQTRTSNPTPDFSISSGSFTVTVDDPNSGNSIYNTVFFNTPVAVGNLLLNGAYDVVSVLSTGSYTIESSVAASTTIASSGILPIFATSSGSPTITVTLPNNNFPDILGLRQTFRAPTTVDGLIVSGAYDIAAIIDSTSFLINANTVATGSTTATMNASLAQLVYYVAIGPQASGAGFGAGGFGDGGFGSGSATIGESGTPITASNWSQDNWGEVLLACPTDGAIYAWSPQSGLQTAQVLSEAPFFNGGIFISQPQQILVAWRSVQSTGTQDNLIVRWSDAGDFTNWTVADDTTAGSFHLPTGSIIMGGLQAPGRGVIWTDIECWVMQYVGGDVIFNFTKVGTGCGLIGQHAAGVIGGEVYWMGKSNFFKLGQQGAEILKCPVWDFIFQNINEDQVDKICCAPNSAFSEIAWFFPSVGSTENDSYVKMNLSEGEWDYGLLTRTAWTDISVMGNPIGSDSGGVLNQHEEGEVQTGTPVTSFQSGWWSIADGQDFSVVDFVMPDFKWSFLSGAEDAQINLTFYAVDYPGEQARSYGPYTVTKATPYITPRFRGRLMSVAIQSNNSVFWRIGRIRYRYAPSGRR